MWRVATETGTMAGPGDQTALNLGERGLHTGRPAGPLSPAYFLPQQTYVVRPSPPANRHRGLHLYIWSRPEHVYIYMPRASCQLICVSERGVNA